MAEKRVAGGQRLLITRGENAEEEKRCSDIGENSIGPCILGYRDLWMLKVKLDNEVALDSKQMAA
jgi:hypothetical protein